MGESSKNNCEIRINGIKLSRELVLCAWHETGETPSFGPKFLALLAANRINIPFLCTDTADGRNAGTCCVEIAHFEQLRKLTDFDLQSEASLKMIKPVGTLGIFPSKSDGNLLGFAMSALCQAGFAIHGMGTSISVITFILDYPVLDRAAAILAKKMNLPPDTAPFRAEFQVVQTSSR